MFNSSCSNKYYDIPLLNHMISIADHMIHIIIHCILLIVCGKSFTFYFATAKAFGEFFLTCLTIKPTNFNNIEKHVKHTLILNVNYVCYTHYRYWANHISENIGSFYTQNEKL